MNDLQKMKELIQKINAADEAYFKNDSPIMTDREYDALVLELKMLERITGIHFSNSPIGKVPSDEKAELKTVRHSKPMLSCNKTKNVGDIIKFVADKDVVLSWKMDGLTIVLRYENGKFIQAVTRGSGGIIGEDVTHTVKHIRNIPLAVPCKENFEVRGEGVLSWEDMQILTKLGEVSATHPRNIAAGAVRTATADRGKLSHIDFVAFELIKDAAPLTKEEQLEFLKKNNFDVVEHKLTCADDDIKECIESWTPEGFAYPVDGLVCEYNDIAYGKSLGATAHHERRMLALKWKDEVKETRFRGVELNTTRTGAVSIIGVFDEVTIDGSRIHRANLHSVTNFEKYKFGVGDIITVYKANMIVPQIAENKMMSGTYELPKFCTCCGERLTFRFTQSGVKELYCPNEDCIARHSQRIARFCDKSAMNIEGLSASVVERMMAHGWLKSYKDIYHLDLHRDEIVNSPRFGVDSYNSIWEAVEKSRKCHMHQFLVGLGIKHLGPEAAKILHQYYYGSMEDFLEAIKANFAFSHIAGISESLEKNIYEWFDDERNVRTMKAVMSELTFVGKSKELVGKNNPFVDATVVVTGTFNNFSREGILDILSALGARTSEHVTEDTDYLIYGAVPSSRKIGLAIQYGVNMISEDGFASMLSNGNEK